MGFLLDRVWPKFSKPFYNHKDGFYICLCNFWKSASSWPNDFDHSSRSLHSQHIGARHARHNDLYQEFEVHLAHPFSLFPENLPAGTVAQRVFVRTCAFYGVILLHGFMLTQFSADNRWRLFGMGLMLPGGGFLTDFSVHAALLFVSAFAVFAITLICWFATGNILAPPLTWIALAVLSAIVEPGAITDRHGQNLMQIILLACVAGMLLILCKRICGRRARKTANAYLLDLPVDAYPRFGSNHRPAPEFSANDLRAMRFVLDRALQESDCYEGFDWLDQFQTAAIRYQLNFAGYALALAQATRLPALGAYLDEAQLRLIRKQTDDRVWKYWSLENLWGNLSVDRDPIKRENIMYSGFCATQIGLFQAASGRRDFLHPGSFTLNPASGEAFVYDYPALVGALEKEYRRSRFSLVACEPNWIYPLCNAISAISIKALDAQSGGDRWTRLEGKFRQGLEENFLNPSGRFIPCLSARTGLRLPIAGGAMPQALPCFFLNACLPDIAHRQWLLLRRSLVTKGTTAFSLRRTAFWPIDTGNYRFSRAASLAATAATAVELGDEEVAQLCLAALDLECPSIDNHGRLYRADASVWAHAVEFLALSGKPDGLRHLIEQPQSARSWPKISGASYPEVLFARAIHSADSLQAILYPGVRPGCYRLDLSALRPGNRYRCEGTIETSIQASDHGLASIHVPLAGRREIGVFVQS